MEADPELGTSAAGKGPTAFSVSQMAMCKKKDREMHIIAGSFQASFLTWKTCPVVLRALQGPAGGNKEDLWYKEVCLSARVPSVWTVPSELRNPADGSLEG